MNSPVYLLVWEQIVWDCLAGLIQTVSVDIRGSILQNLVMCFENLYTIVIICGKDLSLTSNFLNTVCKGQPFFLQSKEGKESVCVYVHMCIITVFDLALAPMAHGTKMACRLRL